jgi:uncharacterized protein with HEPN domain
MLDAAREAMSFVQGLNSSALENDRKLALALVQELAIIGEAAGKVSPDFARSSPEIPWPKIVGMRNRLIHGYREVDLEVVWKAVTEDLPSLVPKLEGLLGA